MDGAEGVNSEVSRRAGPQRLSGAAAARSHLTLLAGLAFCALAFWFELRRALAGNGLSWAYVFEWPLLGVFAVYMWWKILHPGAEKSRKTPRKRPELAPEYSGMLAAWQEHQRELVAEQQGAPRVKDDDSTDVKGDLHR